MHESDYALDNPKNIAQRKITKIIALIQLKILMILSAFSLFIFNSPQKK